jgi:hypothetical protein
MAAAAGGRAHTLRNMAGEFSWLVLVAAFLALAALCGVLVIRVLGIGSPRRAARAAKDAPR